MYCLWHLVRVATSFWTIGRWAVSNWVGCHPRYELSEKDVAACLQWLHLLPSWLDFRLNSWTREKGLAVCQIFLTVFFLLHSHLSVHWVPCCWSFPSKKNWMHTCTNDLPDGEMSVNPVKLKNRMNYDSFTHFHWILGGSLMPSDRKENGRTLKHMIYWLMRQGLGAWVLNLHLHLKSEPNSVA